MFIEIKKLYEVSKAKVDFYHENSDALIKKIENRYIFSLRRKAKKSWFYRNFGPWEYHIKNAQCMCSYWNDPEYIKNEKNWTIALALMREVPFDIMHNNPNATVRITKEEQEVLFGK
jgi:hypothetical protein